MTDQYRRRDSERVLALRPTQLRVSLPTTVVYNNTETGDSPAANTSMDKIGPRSTTKLRSSDAKSDRRLKSARWILEFGSFLFWLRTAVFEGQTVRRSGKEILMLARASRR